MTSAVNRRGISSSWVSDRRVNSFLTPPSVRMPWRSLDGFSSTADGSAVGWARDSVASPSSTTAGSNASRSARVPTGRSQAERAQWAPAQRVLVRPSRPPCRSGDRPPRRSIPGACRHLPSVAHACTIRHSGRSLSRTSSQSRGSGFRERNGTAQGSRAKKQSPEPALPAPGLELRGHTRFLALRP